MRGDASEAECLDAGDGNVFLRIKPSKYALRSRVADVGDEVLVGEVRYKSFAAGRATNGGNDRKSMLLTIPNLDRRVQQAALVRFFPEIMPVAVVTEASDR